MAKKAKGRKKVQAVMGEYEAGTLHSGKGGPVVTSQAQAKAIAMSEAGLARAGKKRRRSIASSGK